MREGEGETKWKGGGREEEREREQNDGFLHYTVHIQLDRGRE